MPTPLRSRRFVLESLESRLVPAFAAAWNDLALGGATAGAATANVTTPAVIRLDAAGTGLAGSAGDKAFFHYKELDSDGTMSAKVNTVGGGLMARDGTADGSPFAALTRTGSGWTFQSRTPTGAVTSSNTATSDPFAKLVRDGNLINAYTSPTGADGTWKLAGSAGFLQSASINVGLVGTSGTNALTSLDFTDVKADAAPPMGAGLEGITYYSYSNAFVDLVKQANTFMSADWSVAAPTDTSGWATTDFAVILQYGGVGTAHTYVGTYNVQFKGQADISTAFSPNGTQVVNKTYDAATNTTTAQVQFAAPESDTWYLALKFTNTKATAASAANTGIRDLRVLRPGYSLTNTPTFTKPLLDQLSRFSNLRYMDWTSTNNSDIANWSDRAKGTDARQSVKGVAWEYVVEMANTLGKDLWVNVPAKATDDYVRQLATLLKTNLRADLAVHVEYSNEVWNGGFTQNQYNRDQATAEVRAGRASGVKSALDNGEQDTSWSQENWGMRRVAQRSKQISDVFKGVWGADAINTRVRVVLPAQFDWAYTLQTEVEFASKTYGSPGAYFWATAGAPYFNTQAVDASSTATADQVLSGLRTAMTDVMAKAGDFTRWGDAYGLRTVTYEGGPDTFGGNNIAAKRAAMNDPRMQTLVQDYLKAWYSNGGQLFNWFVAGASSWDTPFGTWGLTDDIARTTTPKIQGIDSTLAAAAPTAIRGTQTGEFAAGNYLNAPANTTGPLFPWMNQQFDYRLDAPQAGQYTLKFRYGSQTGGLLKVTVNGQDAGTLALAATGSNTNYTLSQAVTLTLPAGGAVIKLEALSHNAYNLQSLVFGTGLTRTKVEAAAAANNQVTLTATVTAADRRTAGGGVQFLSGTTVLGTATLDATGVARLTVAKPAGNTLVTAKYAGSSDYAASTSAAVAVAGTPAATATTTKAIDPTATINATTPATTVAATPAATTVVTTPAPATTATPVAATPVAAAPVAAAPVAATPVAAAPIAGVPVAAATAAAAAPRVESVVIGDGNAQRSKVGSLTVTFSTAVAVTSGAFSLRSSTGGAVAVTVATTVVNGKTVAALSFALPTDGNYTLTTDNTKVTAVTGGAALQTATATSFKQRYGDFNGDGVVNSTDFAVFAAAFGKVSGTTGYQAFADRNGDGRIDATDFQAFAANFGA